MSDDPDRGRHRGDDQPGWAPFGPYEEEEASPPPRPPDRSGGEPLWARQPEPQPEPELRPGPEPEAGTPPATEQPAPPAWPPPPPPAFEPPAAPTLTGPSPEPWPPPHISPLALQRRTSGSATWALVLGILGLFVCPVVCSVAAIALGRSAQRQIDRNPRLDGRGMARTGIVLGWIGVVVYVLAIVAILAGQGTTVGL